MTTPEFLNRLECVRSRGPGKWSARCPGHKDKTPSLTITEGERGLLVRCFSGCGLHGICEACGVTIRDLFYDSLPYDPEQRRAAAQQRANARRKRDYEARKLGRLLDACKNAERFLQSRQSEDISGWSHDRLDRELSLLADAYKTLEVDPYGTR
jgi:hypothetical protein